MTVLADAAPAGGRIDAGAIHLVCCDPDTALCGVDVATEPWIPEGGTECVVCVDLAGGPCSVESCGYAGAGP